MLSKSWEISVKNCESELVFARYVGSQRGPTGLSPVSQSLRYPLMHWDQSLKSLLMSVMLLQLLIFIPVTVHMSLGTQTRFCSFLYCLCNSVQADQ